MDARTLADALDRLVDAHPGSRSPSVAQLRAYLKAGAGLTIDELSARIRSGTLKTAATAKTGGGGAPLKTELVAVHADALTASLDDKAAYTAALEALKIAKGVRVKELKAIVERVTGSAAGLAKKADTFERLERFFTGRKIHGHFTKIAATATPW